LEKEMTAVAEKAEQSFSKSCKALGLTEEGFGWIDHCLDPFKDVNERAYGFPDQVELPSNVQVIRTEYNVSTPLSDTTLPWDCNIFLDQLYLSQEMYDQTTNVYNSVAFAAQASNTPRGGLVIRSAAAGTTLNKGVTTSAFDLPSDVLVNADIRVVGLGLEVHNTTNALNVGGAVIPYRVPDKMDLDRVLTFVQDITGVTACIPTSAKAGELVEPPYTAAEAIDLPVSEEWEAKDGVYIVPVITTPTLMPDTSTRAHYFSHDSDDGSFSGPLLVSTGSGKMINTTGGNMPTGFSLSGAFFTNLPGQTTLKVNLVVYVEVFPNKLNTLKRLSFPSPPEDTKALQLYGRISSKLMAGVPVTDNFLGAFIAGVAKIARGIVTTLPKIVSGVQTGFRVANAIGEGISTVREIMGDSDPHENAMSMLSTQSAPIREIREKVSNFGPGLALKGPLPPQVTVTSPSGRTIETYRPAMIQQVRPSRNNNSNVRISYGNTSKMTQKARRRKRDEIRAAFATDSGPTRNGNVWRQHNNKQK